MTDSTPGTTPRTTLIAEDLLLLLLDEKGTVQHAAYLDTALGGSLLVELSLAGHVEPVAQETSWGFTPKDGIRVTGALPEDPVLRESYDLVAHKERTAQDLVGRLGRGRRDPLLDRLVERGVVRREQARMLGLFSRTTWPEVDGRHEEVVRARLESVLLRDDHPDDRTGALAALLSGLGVAHRVVTGRRPAGEVKKRAASVAEGEWAAGGVKDAIAGAQSAMVSAMVVTTAAGSGS